MRAGREKLELAAREPVLPCGQNKKTMLTR
jgi:hypothetical protein